MATTYTWIGKTLKSGVQRGEMVAEDQNEVVTMLRRQGIIPTAVNEKKAAAPKKIFGERKKKVTERDLVVFTRQFATLFTAGIPIVQGLDILSRQAENKSFGTVIGQIRTSIETGSTFADSMKRHPKIFSDLYTNMVAAGEAGGVLDLVLARLAVYIEKMMKLKKKVKGAMVYPSIVISVAVLVVAIIMIFVIPVFSKIFGEMGVALPLPTQIIIGISNFLAGFGGLVVLATLVGLFFSIRQYRTTRQGRKVTDRALLKAAIVGNLLKKVAIARFSRTLGTLIGSGVPILDALEICAKTAGNVIIEETINSARLDVASGKTVAEPLSKSELFPPMVVQMISVGEASGSLDQMLEKIADFYDDEVDQAVTNLTTALEPLLMVFLGVVIGFIVVSLYLPIFKIGSVVSG